MPDTRAILKLVRPHQWLKNLMLFFPPFLGGTLLQPAVCSRGLLPFFVFSIASSAGYILNDLIDRDVDKNHPEKSSRPIASGKISFKTAVSLALFLALLSLLAGYYISMTFASIVAAYLLVSALYSCCLKNLPVVDIFCISTGFLFRLQAGGFVFEIRISEWLFLSVFLLSLFLSAGKRLSEKLALNDSANSHRKVLENYPVGFLDGILYMCGSAVLVTYTMYILTHKTLIYTVPLCCFGLMRYILQVKKGEGGDPTDSLLRDPWLFTISLAWAAMVGWGLYGR